MWMSLITEQCQYNHTHQLCTTIIIYATQHTYTCIVCSRIDKQRRMCTRASQLYDHFKTGGQTMFGQQFNTQCSLLQGYTAICTQAVRTITHIVVYMELQGNSFHEVWRDSLTVNMVCTWNQSWLPTRYMHLTECVYLMLLLHGDGRGTSLSVDPLHMVH